MADNRHEPPASNVARSKPLAPGAAEGLDTRIERLGVDAERIAVEAEPARGMVEESRADQATIRRPVLRAATGALIGAALGLAVAFVAIATTSIPPAAAIMPAAIIGVLLGGLWSLYAGMPANSGIEDAYAGGTTTLAVDLDGMDPATARRVEKAVDQAAADTGGTRPRVGRPSDPPTGR